MPAVGIALVALLFAVYLYLLVVGFLGLLVSLATVPVFWFTRYGFVPVPRVRAASSTRERVGLVLVHVIVGTVGFVWAAGAVALSGYLGGWAAPATVAFLVVAAIGWGGFVAVPMRSSDDPPPRWRTVSLAAFAAHGLVYLGGAVLVGLVETGA